MADQAHLAILEKGVEAWNQWRLDHPEMTPDLSHAFLTERNGDRSLGGVNLGGGCYAPYVDFQFSDLRNADLRESNFTGVRFVWVDARGADFRGANLSQATFLQADLRGAKLSGANVYGASAWDVQVDENTQQDGLVITPPVVFETDGLMTVDELEVAQFIYLLLNNPKIRHLIDTVTSKAVLILGRFTDERKAVLDLVRKQLRLRGYVPILFDWPKSERRDLTETIQLLANMSRFVVADLTDAKSIPQELSHIIPFLPSLPIVPMIMKSQSEYAMFEHWRGYPAVLPEFRYESCEHLLAAFDTAIIEPVRIWEETSDKPTVRDRLHQNEIEQLVNKVKKLEAKLKNDINTSH